ncbi:MAG: alkaline phosphatase PhoX [Bacteroidota bacterium]
MGRERRTGGPFSFGRGRVWLLGMIFGALLATSCGDESVDSSPPKGPFSLVDTNFSPESLIFPDDFAVQPLVAEGDIVKAEWSESAGQVKAEFAFLAYLPLGASATHGILWTHHCTAVPDKILGDGGGATVLEVYRDSSAGWRTVGYPYAVDFNPVGGTLRNGGGTVTPWGTVLVAETSEPDGPQWLRTEGQIRDTAEAGAGARWKNYGWLVEVDVKSRRAGEKRYALGRFQHAGSLIMSDERTVYLLDGATPGTFCKFVADAPRDLSAGRLYAYRQSPDGLSGTWIPLGTNRDTLFKARQFAQQDSATLFLGLTDLIQLPDGRLLISERGGDSVACGTALRRGGQLALHLRDFLRANDTLHDPQGRILRFDPVTDRLEVLLAGGTDPQNRGQEFSHPGYLALDSLRNRLVIHEDNFPREGTRKRLRRVNEVYLLDLAPDEPQISDLRRLLIAPRGSSISGGAWNSDCSTYFFNLQHPDRGNPPPYNRSGTFALTGWRDQ